MAILLATIAFVLSMVALWFASELARRTDGGAKLALKPHLASLNQVLNRTEAQIRDLSRDLELAQREIKILRAAQDMPSAIPDTLPVSKMSTRAMDNAAAFTPSTTYNA